MPQKYESHRLRTGRVSLTGTAYHLRFGIAQRQKVLSNFYTAHAVARSITREHTAGRSQNLCYCVMPDHVHWLMILKNGSLGQSIHNIKRLSNHLSDTSIPWQRGYFDHAIRDPQNLRAIARYIVANPLRAGLVVRIGDYPHWDAAWLDGSVSDPF